jgi:hypothetical protein
MPETQSRKNGTAQEDPLQQSENGQSTGLGRGVKAALVAAAVGSAVVAAARVRGAGNAKPEGEGSEPKPKGDSSRVRGAVQQASKRGEPVVSAAWGAAKDSLEPLTRSGARQAGRFVAERSPDFVRETIIPPFVEGLAEGTGKSEQGS